MRALHRRSFIALLGAPMLAVVLESCGGDGPVSPAEVAASRSDQDRVATTADESVAAVAAVNDFGVSLYRRLAAADPTGNIVMSPASISAALSVALAGAGTTLDEMVTTLRFDEPSTIHRSMNALTAELERLNRSGVELSIANSLWAQLDLDLEPGFLDLLASEYGAGMQFVDYRAGPEPARLAINRWVSNATADRVPELVPPDVLTVDSRLTLVDAISLKADWAMPFVAGSIADTPFTNAAGDIADVPTLVRTGEFAYTTGDGWRAVELPYADSTLAMLIFAPEDGFRELFEQIFLITDATLYLEPRQVRLQMPRFDVGSSVSLAEPLAAAGMPTAFDAGAADFTGITAGAELFLGAVVHRAAISATGQGAGQSTGAAATAVVAETGAAATADEPIEFVIDRPFVFVVRDRATQAVLFIGRVGDPRS